MCPTVRGARQQTLPRLGVVQGDSRGRNTFCGPAALATVFRISTRIAAWHLRQVTGRKNTFGVYPVHLYAAMHRLGRAHVVKLLPGVQSLERLAPQLEAGIYIVMITGHYVALDTSRMEVCDNGTKVPRALVDYRGRRKHVKKVWRVTQIGLDTRSGFADTVSVSA